MKRLDQERQKKLEPERMEIALFELGALGLDAQNKDGKMIEFLYKGHKVQYFPYSGWHTGKSIKDGRGLQNLLKQLK